MIWNSRLEFKTRKIRETNLLSSAVKALKSECLDSGPVLPVMGASVSSFVKYV